MSSFSPLNAIAALPIGGVASQADWGVQAANSAHAQNAKIEKSAKDFESILLSNWLQQAEQSFASVPGGDEEDDGDSGKEQFQGMAMQSLGASMTAAGGIGIAKMISAQLHKAEDLRAANAEKSNQNPSK
jgi:Rod binding domain-containing protein